MNKVKQIKNKLDEFIDAFYGSDGKEDAEDLKDYLDADSLGLTELGEHIEEAEAENERLNDYISDIEGRLDINPQNLREQMIAEDLAEIFVNQDYRTLEAIIESFKLI